MIVDYYQDVDERGGTRIRTYVGVLPAVSSLLKGKGPIFLKVRKFHVKHWLCF